MKQYQEIKNNKEPDSSVYKVDAFDNLQVLKNKKFENNREEEIFLFKKQNESVKNEEQLLLNHLDSKNLFRFYLKKGEHIYARPNDIIMIESCDHLVNVHLACNNKLKKAIRTNTLKDFLLQLPAGQFVRINRFCAINIHRLSGGNCKDQTFEFDFTFSIKLKHALPQTIFKNIGK